MKKIALAALASIGLLAACRKNVQEAPRDYNGVKQHSQEQHQSLDSQKD